MRRQPMRRRNVSSPGNVSSAGNVSSGKASSQCVVRGVVTLGNVSSQCVVGVNANVHTPCAGALYI